MGGALPANGLIGPRVDAGPSSDKIALLLGCVVARGTSAVSPPPVSL